MGLEALAFLIVGADFLADVAAVDALGFFDNVAVFVRDFSFVFNGEVGDAFAGVDKAGIDDGAGGAGVDAFGALAANAEGFGEFFWACRV